VVFKRPKLNPVRATEVAVAADAFAEIAKSLSVDWLKPRSEHARFEAFRSLPETAKLNLLAYCVAITLKPRLAPATDAEASAYDAALSMTDGSVAAYWRPTKDNMLARLNRGQLLAVGRDVLGEMWAQASGDVKKALLVDQLDRAFSDPEKNGRTAQQAEKLRSWLPSGMSFHFAINRKPAKAKKAKKAA
jgi:hypothetical protein